MSKTEEMKRLVGLHRLVKLAPWEDEDPDGEIYVNRKKLIGSWNGLGVPENRFRYNFDVAGRDNSRSDCAVEPKERYVRVLEPEKSLDGYAYVDVCDRGVGKRPRFEVKFILPDPANNIRDW